MADISTRANADQEAGLLCPACKVDLVMSERQGIEIDYCPKCRGVWLDRGELDKIIERSASDELRGAQAQPSTPPPSSQGQPYPSQGDYGDYESGHGSGHGGGYGGGHGQRRRHGSFLGRLFD